MSVVIYPSTVIPSIYNISDDPYTLGFTNFTDSLSICGDYEYSLTTKDGLSFDPTIFNVSY